MLEFLNLSRRHVDVGGDEGFVVERVVVYIGQLVEEIDFSQRRAVERAAQIRHFAMELHFFQLRASDTAGAAIETGIAVEYDFFQIVQLLEVGTLELDVVFEGERLNP